MRKGLALVLGIVAFNLLFFAYTKASPAQFVIPIVSSLGFLILVISAQVFLLLGGGSKSLDPKNKFYAQILALIAIFSSFLAIFRASYIDGVLLNLLSVGLSFTVLYLVSLGSSLSGEVYEFLVIPQRIFVGWFNALIFAADLILSFAAKILTSAKGKLLLNQKTDTAKGVLRGLLITIPIAGIVLLLLGSADPVFGQLLKEIFNIQLPEIAPWLVIRGIGTLVFLGFAIPFIFLKINKKFTSPFNSSNLGNLSLEMTTLVSVLSFIFAAFLIIQFKYLFTNVAETELIQFGVRTYSEYVRKGFGELTLVSVIIYLTLAVSLSIHKVSDKTKKLLKNLNLILLGETVIFIVSILRRVYLYQLAHGLTRVRVYGSAFLILLLVLTVILMVRQVEKASRNWYIYEIGAVITTVFILGFVNVDKLIANNFPPTVNGETDYVYITKLSADAVDGWIAGYLDAKKEVGRLSGISLQDVNQEDVRKIVYSFLTLNNINSNYGILEWTFKTNYPIYGFRILNLGEQDAYQRLQNSIDKEELKTISDKSSKLYYGLSNSQRYQNFDRSTNTPLVK